MRIESGHVYEYPTAGTDASSLGHGGEEWPRRPQSLVECGELQRLGKVVITAPSSMMSAGVSMSLKTLPLRWISTRWSAMILPTSVARCAQAVQGFEQSRAAHGFHQTGLETIDPQVVRGKCGARG